MLSRIPTVRARTSAPLPIPLVLVLVLILAGCGGSSGNGIASRSAVEILAASRTAAQDASSVHVLSKASRGKLSSTSDLELSGGDGGGRARVSLFGVTTEVVRIGDTVYVKRNPVYYKRLNKFLASHHDSLRVPQGTWLKHTTRGSGKPIQTDLKGELGFLLESTGRLTKGATSTIDGQKVIELKQATRHFTTNTIFIATTGEPYPVEILERGRVNGQTVFTDWNQPVTLSAPANAIELGKKHQRKER